MRWGCVNEKLQIPTAIRGTPRFQFQFPKNRVVGNSDRTDRKRRLGNPNFETGQ